MAARLHLWAQHCNQELTAVASGCTRPTTGYRRVLEKGQSSSIMYSLMPGSPGTKVREPAPFKLNDSQNRHKSGKDVFVGRGGLQRCKGEKGDVIYMYELVKEQF